MPGLIIKLKGVNFNNPNLPTYSPKVNGFIAEGLQNLYLFDDGDPKTSIVDKMGKLNTAIVLGNIAGASKTNLAGSVGVNFTKNSYVQGSPIDVTLPYTIMFAGSLGINSDQFYGVMGFKEFSTYGLEVYGSDTPPRTTTDKPKLSIRPTVNGSQGPTVLYTTTAYTFLDNCTFFLSHNGSGRIKLDIYNGNTLLDSTFIDADLTAMTTNGAGLVNKILTPVVGINNTNGVYTGGNLNVDGFAVYTKALKASEMVTNAQRAKEIMAARGRS